MQGQQLGWLFIGVHKLLVDVNKVNPWQREKDDYQVKWLQKDNGNKVKAGRFMDWGLL